MTAKQYNQVTTDLETAGKANIPERLYHVAADQGDNWHVTDIWQSEEAFNKFAETMMPILIKSGVQSVEPLILDIHNIIT